MELERIQSNRINLRPIRDDDLVNVFKGLSNKEVTHYYAVHFETLEATAEQMGWYNDLIQNDTGVWWTICINDEFTGAIGFNDWDKQKASAEIGFWLLPEYWKKGYVSEALPMVIEYGFSKLGLGKIEAFVEVDNLASKNVLDKAGFNFEKTMQDCELKNGQPIGLDLYAKLK